MASATATAKPEPGSRERFGGGLFGSRLGRLIIALNLLGLTILIVGALVLNELRRGLVNARIDSLSTQGELIASLLNQGATVGEPEPQMDAAYDDQVYVDDRTIDSHIKRMRKKFREVDPEFDAIETLYGVGYRYRES